MTISCDEEKEQSKYKQTKRRLINCSNKYRLASDQEIIEYLAEEIEHYRDRIKKLEEHIRKENCNSKEQNTKVIDKDIQEEETINLYADGKLRQTIINYKYKEK